MKNNLITPINKNRKILSEFNFNFQLKLRICCGQIIHILIYLTFFNIFASDGLGQKMNGNYSIGPGKNFTTIQAAIDSLKSKGTNGTVTFQLDDGTYNEQLQITNFQFADSIIFIGNSQDSSVVTIEFNADSAGNNYVLKIESSRYIFF